MRGVLIMVLLCSTATVGAQTIIPNGGLDSWKLYPGSGSFKDYEEPTEGWSSGNGAIHVAPNADPVCEKTEDAASGAFAAKLTTRRIFGQIASGSLYIGRFELNLANPKESARIGLPCTDVPSTFKGMYKYLPQGGDSAILRATFRRWTGTQREIVCEASLTVREAVAEWTSFLLAIPTPAAQPDTVEVVFASSAGGEFFRGDVGSTLYVDDVSFDAASSVGTGPEPSSHAPGHWVGSSCTFIPDPSVIGQPYAVMDLAGRMVQTGTINNNVDLQQLGCGVYVLYCDSSAITFLR